MALTVQFQLNPCAEPFAPTVKTNKLLRHRLGSGQSALLQAGYVVYCSGEFRGDGGGKKGQGGIGLSVRKSFPGPKYDHQSSSTTGY